MKRTLTVIILAAAALALLVGAAWKSRSIPLSAHMAEFTLESGVARLGDDFATLMAAMQKSWQSSQAPGEAASALHERIVTGLDELDRAAQEVPAGRNQRERIELSFERLRGSMTTFDDLTQTLLDRENSYATDLSALRERGPEVVRQLRTLGQTRVAADIFQLIAETIEYADPASTSTDYDIRRRLLALNRDQRLGAELTDDASMLLAAVTNIVDTRDDTRSRLSQLGTVPLVDYAKDFELAAKSAYQAAASGADRARTMLSIYAVVMLLSVGFIGLRLRGSYREINRANRELGVLNESLEQRVTERTADLSRALAELKESQVQLVQAEKMSSLGQLVAGISHEINTPLLYLANNASLMEERLGSLGEFVRSSAATLRLNPANFDERAEYQSRLIEGLKTLKILLRDGELEAAMEEMTDLNRDSIEGLSDLTQMAQSLKDFSRLDRAPIDSFDVNAGLEKTLTIARNIIKHKAQVRKFYGDIPPVECSPSKINQVFLNLLTNAAQAIEGSGEIVIATRLNDAEHVVISISDTGCGIPEENLSRIRDPFFTTKEVGTGTGLGLSIVDEIIRGHGGELVIESKVGAGSTFSVVLPVHHVYAASTDGSEPDTADGPELAEAV